ncbi:DUF1366 domain-containing protein [Streptococcus cuniculipharyngis]|uniref:DUF1366 domain-containing protein n=1 Tax=Streptococcus cuniculipharyngis TaxID=1562651 RepID=A0A5C5SE66_9STRE|nr:DUF1366 domain-containing protein [Streptococcus cuniculipharyngis]TWS99134.1 DUF1366 domain-containing protein [Streptococcus cuniculipharyngis]
MRSWKLEGKYPVYNDMGVITHTVVTLSATSGGYATFSEKLLGDQTAKGEMDLVDLAREAYFKSEFADRAMAESVQKIDELEATTARVKAFMTEAKALFDEMQGSQKALEERLGLAEAERNQRFQLIEEKFVILNGSVMEMVNEFYAGAEKDEDDETSLATTGSDEQVGGSDSPTDHTDEETE